MSGTDTYQGNIQIKNRSRIELDAIICITAFDEGYVLLDTNNGNIGIEGENLKILDMNNESGKIIITGQINGVYFTAKKAKRGIKGIFS